MKQAPMQTADEMDELYTGGGDDPGEGKGDSIDQEEREEASHTGIVNKMVLQGPKGEPLKVGDEVVVKVKAIHGDDIEFGYSETKPSEIPAGDEYASKEDGDKELDELGESY